MEETKAQKILGKFEKAKSKRQKKDAVWQELDAYDRNEQWDLKNVASWIPKPITNYIHLVKYTKRAAMSVENPLGKIRAVSPAGVERVATLNRAVNNEWERMKARKVFREVLETSKLLGTGIAQVYFHEAAEGKRGATVQGDEGFQYEGALKIRQIDPASFYPDPEAFTVEDCGYIFIRERKSLDWVKNQKGFNINKEVKEGSTGSSNDRGEIYLRDYGDSEGMVDFTTYYEKESNGEGGYTYSCTYLAGEHIVHEVPQILPNRYPFSLLFDFPQRQEFWAMSTCQFILDNQKIVNKVESIIAMIGTLMQNPQKIVTQTSGISVKEVTMYGNLPAQVWQTRDSDPSRSIHYVQPPQIPTVLFNLLGTAKENIREITGLTEAYMGNNVGSLQTSSGVQSLIDRSTMRDRDQMYDVELFVEDLTRLILDFMVTHYDQPRQVRIAGEDPEVFNFEEFVGTEFEDLDYDIHVDVSANAPITRMREASEAKELMQMQGQYKFSVPVIKPQEYMRMAGLAHAEQLIQRMNIDEVRNKVDEAFQAASQMAEALAQGMPPEEVMMMGEQLIMQIQEMAENGGVGNVEHAGPSQAQQQSAL